MTHAKRADILAVGAFLVAFSLGFGLIAADPVAGAPVRVEIRIRYSQYEPSTLVVPAGVPVTFVLRNEDPIDHEWLIGDEEMHRVHRTGTEANHASRPTEVSIPPLTTIETTVTFTRPVAWHFICHLPGHEAYGMVGLLEAR
jgi:uncharacterized cupredoxin-like copper-binding protein